MGYVLDVAYRHDQEPRRLRTREDVDAFVDELLTLGPAYRAATAYAVREDSDELPDHELLVGVSAETGLGAVRYSGEDGTWYVPGGHANAQGVTFAYFGTAHEFPADAEVPLDLVREALWGLLAGRGDRPSGLSWAETE
ncbi:Imm1 family immunity protein [Saccharothrix hoggarensis]|uniref:Imm1 family immunity protein n=1 Tax=Saccharothrix hoggarensis TaxID=913853 RepID=A0ABW3R085_9PSEU